jgi:methylglutaconyl-CoA hydratase
MPYQTLAMRRSHGVEYLTLNRPDVRNAFDDTMIAELSDWAARCRTDPTIDVVVIGGAGKVFAAGADVTWMAKTANWTRDENERDARRMAEMFSTIDSLPMPVVGRVHGAALGGGAGLAAVCDVVVAEESTVFGFTEVRLGLVPAVISPFVLAKIGRSAARELFLTGSRFSAGRALAIGLVHQVVPMPQLDQAVTGVVSDLKQGGREALAAVKALIVDVSRAPHDALAPLMARTIAERRISDEGQEGLRAFLEKRPPTWRRQ